MEIESHEFWTTFAQTAATLAGFTLAGFSIYLANTQRASSDDICHHYGLRDDSWAASWAFIYLILMLFCVPLLLSLLYLWGDFILLGQRYTLWYYVLSVNLFLAAVAITLYLGWVQLRYFRTLAQTHVDEAEFDVRRGTSVPPRTRIPRPKLRTTKHLKVMLFLATILVTLCVLVLNAYNVLFVSWRANHLPPLMGNVTVVSPGTLALIAVGFGLLWIYFHFLLFRPENLVFVASDPSKQDLRRFRQGLVDAAKQIKDLQDLLLPVVRSPDDQLLHAVTTEERSVPGSVQRRLNDLEKRLEGWTWDPRTAKHEKRVDKLSYHLGAIDFCLGQEYLRYGAVKQMLREVELYDSGLANLLRDLVYTWEQFRELSRHYRLAPQARTTHVVARVKRLQI